MDRKYKEKRERVGGRKGERGEEERERKEKQKGQKERKKVIERGNTIRKRKQ